MFPCKGIYVIADFVKTELNIYYFYIKKIQYLNLKKSTRNNNKKRRANSLSGVRVSSCYIIRFSKNFLKVNIILKQFTFVFRYQSLRKSLKS